MPPAERWRPQLDRLARLLSDGRGTEILMELQKIDLRLRQAQATEDGGPDIGVWRVDGDGALHRRPGCQGAAQHGPTQHSPTQPGSDRGENPADWADVEYVPAAGAARRVVLLGESAARGWPYDPVLSCAGALQRNLDAAGDGAYQCVDLAKIRASATDLIRVAGALPLLKPDVVVAFVGNNVAVPPEEIDFRAEVLDDVEVQDALAQAVRDRGYPGMRDALAAVAAARGRLFLDRLAALQEHSGARIVIVIPEFNLCGWAPEPAIEVPVLDPSALAAWYALRADAARACDEQRWADVGPIANKMRQLDEGTSPVPGYLAGLAALALDDPVTARAALEESRDAPSGLMVSCTPRVTRPLQRLLAGYAADRGWPCVDLRAVLADPARPQLPGERFFHDYCHLSDLGIEHAMAAVTDAVLGAPPRTTPPGPGVPPPLRAFARAHAAVHLAYVGQPAATVRAHLRAAVEQDPALLEPLAAIRDLLSAPDPRWAHPATAVLAAIPQVHTFLVALGQTGRLPAGLWTLRECLGEVVGPETTGDCTGDMDLLEGPHCGGQPLPNYTPARCHHQATAQRSSFSFALDLPRRARLKLTYRMPSAPPASVVQVLVNGGLLASLPARAAWTEAELAIPAELTRPGVNHVEFRWPVPAPDVDALRAADAAALARGQFPYVLPIFGELFTARIHPDGGRPNGRTHP